MEAKTDVNLATPCGSYCGECQYYNKSCEGCDHVEGKPFWGKCRFYPCAGKRMLSIAVCAEFPCDYYLSTYDPNEGAWMIFYRAGQLVYRKKIGTERWLGEKIRGKNVDPRH